MKKFDDKNVRGILVGNRIICRECYLNDTVEHIKRDPLVDTAVEEGVVSTDEGKEVHLFRCDRCGKPI